MTDASAIHTIWLDSPPANAITWDVLEGIHRELDAAQVADAHAILFRGRGRFFCAGVDIGLIGTAAQDGGAEIRRFGVELQALFQRIEGLPLVSIAAIHGYALGGGLELALACDLRVADGHAKVGLPEAKLGLLPGAGGTQRLTRLAGRGVAMRMILTGELVESQEALRMGVVEFTSAPGDLESEVDALIRQLLAIPREAIAASKACVNAALSPRGFAAEIDHTAHLLQLPETRRRLSDFLAQSPKQGR